MHTRGAWRRVGCSTAEAVHCGLHACMLNVGAQAVWWSMIAMDLCGLPRVQRCSTAEADHCGLHACVAPHSTRLSVCSTAEADHSGLHKPWRHHERQRPDVLNGRSRSQRAARGSARSGGACRRRAQRPKPITAGCTRLELLEDFKQVKVLNGRSRSQRAARGGAPSKPHDLRCAQRPKPITAGCTLRGRDAAP